MSKRAVLAMGTALAAATLSAAPAIACRNPAELRSLFHQSLRAVGNADFVAEVEILDFGWSPNQLEVPARILSLVRGANPGAQVTLDIGIISSCDIIPVAGQRGLIAGNTRRAGGAVVVIAPLRPPPRQPDG